MGIKQKLSIPKYDWHISIYYTVSDSEICEILEWLKKVHCSEETYDNISLNLHRAWLDTGFAYSNYEQKESILVIHKASSIGEFINTFEHERHHLEVHIQEALGINPYSEEAAHFSGDLAQQILEEALCSIVEL